MSINQTLTDVLYPFVAADLPPGVPLYAILSSEAPPVLEMRSNRESVTVGITGRNLDAALRPWLEMNGSWQGRGPALVVDNFAATQLATERINTTDSPLEFWQLQRGMVLSCALHELAHILTRPIDLQPIAAESVEQMEAILAATSARFEERSAARPAWLTHDLPFLRCLCHLAYRMRQAGEWVDLGYAFDGEHHDLSPIAAYADALGDEPQRLAHLTFAELAATAPPHEFVELWRSDIGRRSAAGDDPELCMAAIAPYHPLENVRASFSGKAQIGVADGAECVAILAGVGQRRTGTAKRFEAVVYNGEAVSSEDVPGGMVFDLKGIRKLRTLIATLDGRRVGHVNELAVEGSRVSVKGILSFRGEKSREISESAENDYPWQLMLDVRTQQIEVIRRGESAVVNGQTIHGPVSIARQFTVLGVKFDGGEGGEARIYSKEVEDD